MCRHHDVRRSLKSAGEGRLEALEGGIGVGEKVIRNRGKCARLDVGGRQLGPDQVGRGGPGEGKVLSDSKALCNLS